MTDAELLEIIADGIVDGTDMDCTPADQARAVLKALRDAGVFRAEWERGRDAVLARIIRTAKGYERVDDNMSGSAMRILAYHVERLTPEAPQ